jgi:NitT/TauT family transport system ATP-binding protein
MSSISFSVDAGQSVAILGPSGCGKTSLLNIIAGLLVPTSGEVLFAGSLNRPRIGFMFQESVFLPWRNNINNLRLGLEVAGGRRRDHLLRIRNLLAEVGLGACGQMFPRQCSGGMRRKLALIRTLLLDPELFLLDEPFSNLDFMSREDLEQLVYLRIQNNGIPSVLVTHQIDEALALADKIVLVAGRPMRIREVVPLDGWLPKGCPDARRGSDNFSRAHREVWAMVRGLKGNGA